MARIPDITIVTRPKPWRVLQRPGVISIGAVLNNNPSSVGSTLISVGLTDAAITWNPNIEVDLLSSDQMFNPHGSKETQWGHQFTMSLDHFDIYNIALAMSYDQDAVSASSMLYLDGYNPSPYRCVQIQCMAPKNVSGDTAADEYIEFYKAKVICDGSVEIGKTVKSSLPISAVAIANASDIVGALRTSTPINEPLYEHAFVVQQFSDSWTGDSSIITAISEVFSLSQIAITLDAASEGQLSIILDAVTGTAYDTTLKTFNAGDTDYWYQFNEGAVFADGDEIRVEGNIGAGVTAYVTLLYNVYYDV